MRLSARLLSIIIFSSLIASAQNNMPDVNAITKNVIGNIRSNSGEKMFLETNKRLYGSGETIWFKAFIVDSLHNRITGRSKILFVDLVNDNDNVLDRLLLHGDDVQTNGKIILNDTLHQGFYWLRAYTKQVLEENIKNIAILPLYIANATNTKAETPELNNENNKSSSTGQQPIIQLSPEGGALISGTTSTVALRATNEAEFPVAISGFVKDNKGRDVADFATNNEGLAKFSFEPTWYGKYSLFVNNQGQSDSITALPHINPFAAQVSVISQTDESIKIRVALEDSIYTNDYKTFILGISKDSLCFAAIGQGMYELNIPASNFPGGIATLLLYNDKQKLVSQRSLYISKKQPVVKITADKDNYEARENVKLDISVSDNNGKPLLATLSVSVVDSRLADTVNHFFTDSLADLTPEEADLKMLVKKPHDFSGQQRPDIDNDSLSKIDESLTLKGEVVNNKKQALEKREVVLMSKTHNPIFLQDTTDQNGKFMFILPYYDDSTEFNLQINNMKGNKEDYSILAEAPEFPIFKTPETLKQKFYIYNKKLEKNIQTNHLDSLIIGEGKGWLTPVSVEAEANIKSPKKSTATISQSMLREGSFNNVGEAVLRTGKLHTIGGFVMTGGPNGFSPAATDEPKVFIDGQEAPVSGAGGGAGESSPVMNYLKTLSTTEIDYINVLTGAEAGMYGVRGGHGVIDVHTTSKVNNYALTKGINTLYLKGFYVSTGFDMPDYSNKQKKFSKLRDTRTTIYWNGDVVTGADGKATLNFYTADEPAIYIITVAGITANGDKIYKNVSISRH